MNLAAVEELVVVPVADDRVQVQWRVGDSWDGFEYGDEDGGYADDEDILWWLLRQRAPLALVRTALAVPYPEFDVDAVLDRVTMPDRAERRAEDVERRRAAKAEFQSKKHVR